jgi:hypothetical protein
VEEEIFWVERGSEQGLMYFSQRSDASYDSCRRKNEDNCRFLTGHITAGDRD